MARPGTGDQDRPFAAVVISEGLLEVAGEGIRELRVAGGETGLPAKQLGPVESG
jgi:hypothetical protein